MPRFALALAALAAALAGCGGDEQKEASKPVTVPADRELRIVGSEYEFEPAQVIVTGEGRVKLTLDNRGSLAHNVRLFRDGRDVGGTPTFQGDTPRSGSVRLASGEYQMICTVGNHEELGMKGSLDVP